MQFNVFTLHPDLFTSFFANSLIARGVSKEIINYNLINWRDKFGIGNYKQIDDKPRGGGNGMVLMCQPIFEASSFYNKLGIRQKMETADVKIVKEKVKSEMKNPELFEQLPNNRFFEIANKNPELKQKSVNISLTPRGYQFSQEIAQYLADNFQEINLFCGRYEGFDQRVNVEIIDLEISIGPFVTNGGEIPAQILIETVSRLIPGFVTKEGSVLHDSYSAGLNIYKEFSEMIIGKNTLKNREINQKKPNSKLDQLNKKIAQNESEKVLFCPNSWIENILPKIEHPQYAKPNSWNGKDVPPVLLGGDHKLIDKWRRKWY